MLKRTVIKFSGEALAGKKNGGQTDANGTAAKQRADAHFDDIVINTIVCQIKQASAAGTQIALVVGGGNFWRGRSSQPDMDRVKSDQIGMLATVMNALYLSEAFRKQGMSARVMTPLPYGNLTTLYDKDTALRLMTEGTVVINAAGLGHPYFSTDTITALRATELEADCVLYAKNVDGVYDRDPRTHPEARKYKSLSYRAAIAGNLNAADMAAMHLSSEAGMPSYVFGLDEPDSVINACAFPDTGILAGTLLNVESEEVFYVNAHETL